MEEAQERELRSYLRRVGERWPLDAAYHRRRDPDEEHLVVLVSQAFDGMPWLERVYQCGALWDTSEMGAPADVHCYTAAEFERKRETLPRVRGAAEAGLDLLAAA